MISDRASYILALGFLSFALGVFMENYALISIGTVLVPYILVNWAFYRIKEKAFNAGISVERRLERDRVFAGKKVLVTVTLKNSNSRTYPVVRVTDHVPEGFEVLGDSTRVFSVDGPGEYSFSYFVIPRRRGVHRFNGISVYASDSAELFFNSEFFDVKSELFVYPSVETPSTGRISFTGRSRLTGMHRVRQRGTGTEFGGIREYAYGDAFRAIAWKATARLNKPMTREFESDVNIPVVLFLDASATMDSGKKGYTKLDYAVNSAVAFLKLALESNDPFGVYTFTHRIEGHIPLGKGRKHFYSALELLTRLESPTSLEVIGKDTGMHLAVKHAITTIRRPALFVIISDLEGIEASHRVRDTIKLAKAYHNNVLILSPFSPYFERGDKGGENIPFLRYPVVGRIIEWLIGYRGDVDIRYITEDIYSLKFLKSRQEFSRQMIAMGVPVLTLGPDDLIATLLYQLIKMKRRRIAVV